MIKLFLIAMGVCFTGYTGQLIQAWVTELKIKRDSARCSDDEKWTYKI